MMTRIACNTKDCFILEHRDGNGEHLRMECELECASLASKAQLWIGDVPVTPKQCSRLIIWLERAQRATSGFKGL